MDEHQLLVQLLTEVRDTNRALVAEIGQIRKWFDIQRRFFKIMLIFFPFFLAGMLTLILLTSIGVIPRQAPNPQLPEQKQPK